MCARLTDRLRTAQSSTCAGTPSVTFRLEAMLPSAFESPWSPAHSQPFQYIPTPNPMPLRPNIWLRGPSWPVPGTPGSASESAPREKSRRFGRQPSATHRAQRPLDAGRPPQGIPGAVRRPHRTRFCLEDGNHLRSAAPNPGRAHKQPHTPHATRASGLGHARGFGAGGGSGLAPCFPLVCFSPACLPFV